MVRLAQLRRLEHTDIDHLEAAEGRATRRWTECSPAAAKACRCTSTRLLDDLENNCVDNADARRQMAKLGRNSTGSNGALLPLERRTDRRGEDGTSRSGRAGSGWSAPTARRRAGRRGKRREAVIGCAGTMAAATSPAGTAIAASAATIGQLLHDQEDIARRTLGQSGRRTLTRELAISRRRTPPN